MSNWKECKLGEVAVFQRGHDLPKTEMNSGSIPVAGSNGIIGYHNEATTKGPGITIGRSGNIGTPKFYESDFWAHNTVLYVKDFKGNDEKFVFYFLHTFDFSGFNAGSAVPTLNRNHIHEIPVIIPPLPEQRAIAGVLSSLDDKIDLLHRQNKTLEGIAEALWRKIFVEEMDPGWKKGKLGDIAEETIGGDWGEDTQSNELIPIICLRGVDLQNIKESGFSSEAPIRFIKPTSLEKRTLHENEILIAGSGIGPIGKSIPINSALLGCYSYPVIYSNFCKRLRTESKEMAYFIEFMIYQFYKEGELDQFHMGTSVPNFNLKDFLNFEVSVPPRDIVSLFSSFLTDWYNKKFTNQIRTLSILRDTLLPKLMSGEVRVRI